VRLAEPGIVANGLKEAVLKNMKQNAPDVKVTLEETRKVTGHEVLVLGIEGTVSNIPLRYLIYYYSGSSGTIGVLTYTNTDAFEKNVPAFTELLNGLEINDSPLDTTGGGNKESGPGRLTLASGKALIEFEKSKWKQLSSQVGRYTFAHNSGKAYALVISEDLIVPLEAISNIALSNMKREAPDACAGSA
jgi:hypothetical protein